MRRDEKSKASNGVYGGDGVRVSPMVSPTGKVKWRRQKARKRRCIKTCKNTVLVFDVENKIYRM